MREGHDDPVPGSEKSHQVTLGLREPARRDGRALRLERKLLTRGKRIELDDAAQLRRIDELLRPHRAHAVGHPDDVAALERGRQVSRHLRLVPHLVSELRAESVEPALRGRVDERVLHRVERALGKRREGANGLHVIPEELDAKRVATRRSEHVDEPTANSELPTLLDPLDPLVAGDRELLGQPVDPRAVAHADLKRRRSFRQRWHALREAERRSADKPAAGQHVESPGPLADEMGRRSDSASEGHSARGEETDPIGSEKPAHPVGCVASIGVLRHQTDEPAARILPRPHSCQHQRQQRLRDPRRRRPRGKERSHALAASELGSKRLQHGSVHRKERSRAVHSGHPRQPGRQANDVRLDFRGATPDHHPLSAYPDAARVWCAKCVEIVTDPDRVR